DIKPSNIMIDKSGRAYLMDFGIARQAQDTMLEVTGRDSSGTTKYMSPQHLAGKNSTSNDIYSFAATVYEMLSGSAPFHSGDITYQIREVPPKPVPHLDAHVNEALLAGLSKDPIQRPSTATELAHRIVDDPAAMAFDDVAAEPGAVQAVPRRTGGPTRRTRSSSRSRSTSSRSRTAPTPMPAPAAATVAGAVYQPPVFASVAAGALWAAVGAVGLAGLLMGAAALMREPIDPAAWFTRPLVLAGLGAGFVLGALAGVTPRLLARPAVARVAVGVTGLVTLAAVLAVSFSRTGDAPLDPQVMAALFALAMGSVGLAAVTLPDIWARTGPALLAGALLAALVLGAGLATSQGGMLESAVAPALAVLLLAGLGAAAAAGRATVQAGLLAGLPCGLFLGLLSFAAVLAAQPEPNLVSALVGGVIGFAMAPVGGLFAGFIARWWNPVGA
ncbi:MAG: protein kinase, partial [Phycisphaerales bacterium]|nr:protein kinase [Phycisphaerales bacterium]